MTLRKVLAAATTTTTRAARDQTTLDATIKVQDEDVHALALVKNALALMIGMTVAITSQVLIAQIVLIKATDATASRVGSTVLETGTIITTETTEIIVRTEKENTIVMVTSVDSTAEEITTVTDTIAATTIRIQDTPIQLRKTTIATNKLCP